MGSISVIKRVLVVIIVVLVLFFWVRSIFSNKNLPDREVKYTYSSKNDGNADLAANSGNDRNARIKKEKVEKLPPPPKKVAGGTEVDGHVPGKVGSVSIQPPPDKTGKGTQPSPPPVPVKSPPPPPDMEKKKPVDVGSKESPIPKPETEAPPGVKEKQIITPVEVAESTPVSKKKKKIALFTIPGENDLKTYFDWRLNIQIKYPKKWILAQSTSLPEFSCTSRQADNFNLKCRRQKIMKDRKFADEVKTIFGFETTGRAIENVKKHTRKIGKHQLTKFTMDEYKLDLNSTKKMKSKLTFLFIEAGDEIAMFFFEVPYEYGKKANTLVNKMIKSIKVVKRPEPGVTGDKK